MSLFLKVCGAWFVAAGIAMTGCASQTRLPEPVRLAIAGKHTGRVVELRQSCFYGDLYDENQLWLLSPYDFANTSHIDDTYGHPIHPHVQRGLLPAGTKLVIERIEFPDSWAMARRMLTTPRYNPWVYVRAAPDTPLLTPPTKPFIWVLPADLDTAEAVESAIDQALAPDGEITAWLATLRPTVRVAVQHKDIVLGMRSAELKAAMGEPQHRLRDMYDGQPVDIAWYTAHEAWMLKDTVVDIKPSRTLPANQ